jgi:hypothetical protein
VRPDGQTAAGVERIAGREAELQRLHERYYVPACDGGLVDAAKRDDITRRVAERPRESQAALRRRAFATRGRPAFDVYEDTAERRQARAAGMRHRAWSAGFFETPRDRVSDDTPDARRHRSSGGAVCRPPQPDGDADRSNPAGGPPAAFDPDADTVAERTLRVLETIERRDYTADSEATGTSAPAPTVSRGCPSASVGSPGGCTTPMATGCRRIIAASRALYHNRRGRLRSSSPFGPLPRRACGWRGSSTPIISVSTRWST